MSLRRLFGHFVASKNGPRARAARATRWGRARLDFERLEDRAVPATITVTGTADTNAVDLQVSLREAIASITAGGDVNSDVTGNITGTYGVNDTIIFSGLFGSPQTITVINGQMTIGNAVTIVGPGSALLTLQNATAQSATSRFFDINVTGVNADVKISGMTMSGGSLSSGAGNVGGAIRNADEALELTGMAFTNNAVVGQASTSPGGAAGGAAIAQTAAGGTLKITNSSFSANTATGSTTTTSGAGGAIAVMAASTVTITNSTFSNNSAGTFGGVIQITAPSTLNVTGSTFTANRSGSTGGVLSLTSAASSSSVSIGSSSITSNTGTSGGALNIAGASSTVTLNGDTVTGNGATAAGGFLNIAAASVTLNSSSNLIESNGSGTTGGAISTTSAAAAVISSTGDTFTLNTAGSDGGAINIGSSTTTLTFTNSSITSNVANATGGAIRLGSVSSVTFNNCTISLNTANTPTLGGGVIYNSLSTSTITVNNSVVDSNSAAIGGVFYLSGSASLTISGSTFSNNQASGSSTASGGGAINVTGTSTVTITSSTFSANHAANTGGAIRFAASGQLTVNNSTFSGNSADGAATGTVGGGAIILSDSSIRFTLGNSTVVNNVAGGATGQGGGILRTTTTSGQGFNRITSSLIAGNSAVGFGQDMRFTFGYLTLGGGANLVGVADDGNFSLGVADGVNVTGTLASPLNPMIGPLANNGGSTLTHGLLLGSPAFGAGNQNGQPTDQTGKARPPVAPAIGATETLLKAPSASATLVAVTSGAGTYVAKVVYRDNTGINAGTIAAGNVTLTGPGGALSPVGSPSISGSGTSVTVTYTFTAPGGSWGTEDNGAYQLTMNGGQVFDIDSPTPLAVPAQALGSVRVDIPIQYTVDNILTDTDDSNYGPGQLTLREAIKLSNENNVGFADLIKFAPSLNGQTITLNSELSVTDPVFIQGNGRTNTILAGAGTNRLFNFAITGSALITPSTISDLAMTGGKLTAAGNGGTILLTANVLNLTNVSITQSTVTSGSGGAIGITSGAVILTDSAISGGSASGSGGAITNSTGKIELVRSMISGNQVAGSGGALNTSSGVINLLNSALGENTAAGSASAGGGGAIMSTSGSSITIINSTLAQNRASAGRGGAILSITSGANISIYNSTIANNTAADVGGGVAGNVTSTAVNPFFLDVRSSIIAQNSAASNGDLYQQTTTAGVYNVTINNSIIGNGNMTFGGAGNLTGVSTVGLAPYGFYGGSTKALGLLAGSLALDFGVNPLGLTTDQRGTGFPRMLNGTPDVGAFEGLAPTPTASATLNSPTQGASTYVATVVYSSAVSSIDTTTIGTADVTLSGGKYVGNATPSVPPVISGSGGSVTVTYTFTAPGGTWGPEDNGSYTLTLINNQVFDINGLAAFGGSLGVFSADFGTTFVVDKSGDEDNGNTSVGDLTLREAIKLANAFSSTDTITFSPALNNSTITLELGELPINQSVIIQGNLGGNLTVQAGNASAPTVMPRIFNVAISGNKGSAAFSNLGLIGGSATTTTAGGAILNSDESISLTNMTITGHAATNSFGQGGAIASSGSGAIVTINNSVVSSNQATGGGGAIYYSSAGVLNIQGSKFENNSAGSGGSNGGGVIYSQSGLDITIGSSTFTSNSTSANWGGAIAVLGVTNLTITDSKFESNVTTGSGGGGTIYSSTGLGNSSLSISNSTITLSSTGSNTGGGAIYFSSNFSTITITGSTLTDNTANGNVHGGAIQVSGQASATISHSVFSRNRAGTFGGAIYFASTSAVSLDTVLVSDNRVDGSSAEGGGIFMGGGSLSVLNSGIVNNTAVSSGSFGGSGGGISTSSAAITIINSTLSGNSAYNVDSSSNNPGGGAIAIRGVSSGGPLVIRNSTIANNTAASSVTASVSRGGGIIFARSSPSVTIESSIIADNVNAAGRRDLYLVSVGSPIDGDNNIVGVADDLNFSGVNNKTGTLATPFVAGLFPLTFNGGITPTHPLWYNSPAIDAGLNSLGLAYDQRGGDDTGPLTDFPRVIGIAPDVGAFEGFLDVSPFVSKITGIVDVVTTSASPYEFTITYDGFKGIDPTTVATGDLLLTLPNLGTVVPTLVSKTTIGNAVEAKYSFAPPGGSWDPTDNGSYTITLNPNEVADKDSPTPKTVPGQTLGVFRSSIGGTFVVDRADIDVDDGNYTVGNLTLREAVNLSNLSKGDHDTILFLLPAGTTITLNGSALPVTDPMTVTGPGAAALTVSGNNSSRIFEFAILGAGGLSNISGLTLTGGFAASGSGGAISADNDALTLTDVTLTNNTVASGGGGAISVGTTTLTILNSVFSDNSASGNGGAILSTASSGNSAVSITGSTLSGNQGATGGAVAMPSQPGAVLTIVDSKLLNNTASAAGGALGLTTSPATITGSTLAGNVALGNTTGGGAINSNTSMITISASTLSGNSATGTSGAGGAWRLGGAGTITLTNSTVSGNSATATGGAFHFASAGTVSNPTTVNLRNSTIANNTAGTEGGAIFTAGTSLGTQPAITITSSIVAANPDSLATDISSALDQLTATVTLNVTAENSIISLNTHSKVSITPSGTTLVGTTGSPIDAKLAPLASNGGPTQTHQLLPGSPAINTGSNPDGLTTDQRGALRESPAGLPDMGAYEVSSAAKITGLVINNGDAQRSRVTTVRVNFDQPVTINNLASAFSLARVSDSAAVNLAAVLDPSGTFVTMTFTAGAVDGKAGNLSLADGRYVLTAVAAQFTGTGLDGNGDGTGGDNYLSPTSPFVPPSTPPTGIFRLFGDADGSGQVSSNDFLAFRLAFLSANDAFDFDGNGSVDSGDFLAFRLRFLQSV